MYGIYIYCLTQKNELNGFNAKGLDDQSIFNVECKDIMALVHPNKQNSLQDEDTDKIIESAMRHHQVVEDAWKAFGTLIPLRFGSVIQGENKTKAIQNVKEWLDGIYDYVLERFEDLKDKSEYGIQIFWPNEGLMKKVVNEHSQIKHMERKIASVPKEVAYMYKDKQKSLLQRYIAKEIVHASRSLLERVRPHFNDFQIEQITVGEDGKRMLLNISCLLSNEQISDLRQTLEKIRNEDGYMPYLSGPWPPYSFTRLDNKLCPNQKRICLTKSNGRARCA